MRIRLTSDMDSLVIQNYDGGNTFTATLNVLHDDSMAQYVRTFTVERDPERYNRWALVLVALQVLGPETFQRDGWVADARSLDR